MELSVLFMGPVGCGKTTGIQSISDIEVVNTDTDVTDETARIKPKTTVAMDMGVMHLGENDKLRLYGAPGQDRFDFMWDILLERCNGVVLMLNHAQVDSLRMLDHYLQAIHSRLEGRTVPMVIGVTHVEQNPCVSIDIYRRRLSERPCKFMDIPPPVFEVDAREPDQMSGMLAVLFGLYEISQGFWHRGKHRSGEQHGLEASSPLMNVNLDAANNGA